MGRYAIIIVTTLVFVIGFFVIANNRLKLDSTQEAITLNEINHMKNLSHSALQIGIKKILNTDWEFPKSGISKQSSGTWQDLMQGEYNLSAIREQDKITLTSLATSAKDSRIKHKSTAIFGVLSDDPTGLSNFPRLYSLGEIDLRGNVEVIGSLSTTGSIGMKSKNPNHFKKSGNPTVTGNLYVGVGADLSEFVGSQFDPIQGDILELDYDYNFFPVEDYTFPSWTGTKTLDIKNNEHVEIDQNGNYNLINIRNGGVLTITSDVTLNVRDLNVSGQLNIEEPNGRLTLFVDNEFDLTGVINQDGDHSKVSIYYYCNKLQWSANNAGIFGSLYLFGDVDVKITGGAYEGLFYAPGSDIEAGGGVELGNAIGRNILVSGTVKLIERLELDYLISPLIQKEETIVYRFSY